MFGRLWSSYGSGPPTQGGLICASAFSEVQFVFYGHDKTSSRVLSFFHGVFFAGSVVPCRRSTPGKCNRHESYVAPHACRCTSMHVGETILKSDAGHVVPRPHRLAGVAQSAHGTQHLTARNNLRSRPKGPRLVPVQTSGRRNSRNRGVVRACQALLDDSLSGGRPNGLRL
jgi:hypothetical protein